MKASLIIQTTFAFSSYQPWFPSYQLTAAYLCAPDLRSGRHVRHEVQGRTYAYS